MLLPGSFSASLSSVFGGGFHTDVIGCAIAIALKRTQNETGGAKSKEEKTQIYRPKSSLDYILQIDIHSYYLGVYKQTNKGTKKGTTQG